MAFFWGSLSCHSPFPSSSLKKSTIERGSTFEKEEKGASMKKWVVVCHICEYGVVVTRENFLYLLKTHLKSNSSRLFKLFLVQYILLLFLLLFSIPLRYNNKNSDQSASRYSCHTKIFANYNFIEKDIYNLKNFWHVFFSLFCPENTYFWFSESFV